MFSSLVNVVHLHELLEHFDIYEQASREINSHDQAINEFCSTVTIQKASQEEYSFMPNCNRHFFLLDTVEFRLDLSYRHQFLSEVMKLIEDTFPQMFHYVKLRCVSVEAHAVSVKCFAPCDLRLALLKQRDMANFLRSRQNVLSIIVGGVEIAEQASAKEVFTLYLYIVI